LISFTAFFSPSSSFLHPTPIGQSKISNQPDMVVPPLMVIGIVGAGGKTYSILEVDRDGWMDGSWDEREDHPAGVSPRP
jgi:hypothetical protein